MPCNDYTTSDMRCVLAINCPLETYANLTTKKCEFCSKNCKICKDEITCTECVDAYYLNGVFLCVDSSLCGTYNYPDIVSKSCKNCDS